jgi:gas vesicle protein
MTRQYEEDQSGNPRMSKRSGSGAPAFVGFMVGGLIGAVSMLLLAPQSGRDTREAVQAGASDLKDRATDQVQGAVSQAKSRAQQVASTAKDKAMDLQNQGMSMAADQLDRVAKAAQSGKKAIKEQQSNQNNQSSY